MKIVIDKERPISWNKMYESRHWIFRKKWADAAHAKVLGVLFDMGYNPLETKRLPVFKRKVNITFTAYFDKRPLDPDNICDKIYIDAFKKIIIPDDTMEFVGSVKCQSELDKKHPRIEIEII